MRIARCCLISRWRQQQATTPMGRLKRRNAQMYATIGGSSHELGTHPSRLVVLNGGSADSGCAAQEKLCVHSQHGCNATHASTVEAFPHRAAAARAIVCASRSGVVSRPGGERASEARPRAHDFVRVFSSLFSSGFSAWTAPSDGDSTRSGGIFFGGLGELVAMLVPIDELAASMSCPPPPLPRASDLLLSASGSSNNLAEGPGAAPASGKESDSSPAATPQPSSNPEAHAALTDVFDEPATELETMPAPDIAGSRLARRWLAGIQARSSSPSFTPSMLDLTKLMSQQTELSPTSIVGSFDEDEILPAAAPPRTQ